MKNKFLLIAALTLSVATQAQTPCNTSCGKSKPEQSDDKMSSMNHNVDNTRYSVINPEWLEANKTYAAPAAAAVVKDCYKMQDYRMLAIKNGTNTNMTKYMTLKNGDVVLITGVVITNSGKILRLQNGDSVDMNGFTTIAKTDDEKEQVTL